MRNLTIANRIIEEEIAFLERFSSRSFPTTFKSFLQKYAGHRIKENAIKLKWKQKEIIVYVNELLDFQAIHSFLTMAGPTNASHVPFANDPNGMYFFLSLKEGSYGFISILSVDLSKEHIVLTESIEDFIDRLYQPIEAETNCD